jgi:general stress protein 26
MSPNETQVDGPTGQEAQARFAEMVRGMRSAMLTTVGPDGSLRSRPLTTRDVGDDGMLWFLLAADSGAVQDLLVRTEVNVAYASPDDARWVSVSGVGALIRDPDRVRELWNPVSATWFPAGPEDPQIRVLRVTVEDVHYWDAPASRMVRLAGFVKALVTGDRDALGHEEALDLRDVPRRTTT